MTIELEIDGEIVAGEAGARRLSDFLRDTADATSVKVGCEEGACGACTVQLDGCAVPSCLVPIARAQGSVVRTAASLASTTEGERVVAALAGHAAVQCGFCTPGIVVEVVSALAGRPLDHTVGAEELLAGHLCRCTGYVPLLHALRQVLSGVSDTAPAPGTRVDLLAKARGTARYAADASPRPHLYATVIGSPVVHARIRVDTQVAVQLPGVRAVLGPDDDPGTLWSPAPHGEIYDTRVFTSEPRFVGDIVAAVVATSREALQRGVEAITVDIIEDLPHVTSLDAALQLDAALAERSTSTNVIERCEAGATRDVVDASTASADTVTESTYEIDPAPHGYLERPAAAAEWGGAGRPCRVWSTTQHPFLAAAMLARILGVPTETVAFEPVYVGGGFGGKEELWLEPAAALLSRACGGAAVLVEVDRALANRSRGRHGGRITIRTGLDGGRISAWDVHVDLDAGADSGHSPDVIRSAVGRAVRAVAVPASRAVGRAIRTNTTPATAFRGYGGPEALFAAESELDEVARSLGVDPVEFRILHGLRTGATDPMTGGPLHTFELERCLRRAVELAGPRPRRGTHRWRRGRGSAALCDTSGISHPGMLDEAVARCGLVSGQLVVETGVAEIGQGNHTAFVRIAAEALGVGEEHVELRPVSSLLAPPDGGVYASRGVHVTGTAVHRAATRLLDVVRQTAAERLDRPYEAVRLRPDAVVAADDRELHLQGLPDLYAEGHFAAPDGALVAGAQLVDVAVDLDTGTVLVERVVSVHDIGRVIHPQLARGQVYGGVVQGIGLALMDPTGASEVRGFLDHLIPTAADVPEIVVDFVEVPHPTTPLGAKGIGEAPIIGIAPAIANAIADSTGARVRHLPMTPERVLAAVERAAADRSGAVVA